MLKKNKSHSRENLVQANKLQVKGFTLLEVMVVVGISAFIMAVMYGTLTTARRSWLTADALITVRQDAQLGLDNMVRELRLASFATVSADNRTVNFRTPIDADGDGFVDLIPSTSTVIYGAENNAGWSIEYQIDTVNNQIIRRVLNNGIPPVVVSQRILTRHINPGVSLTFFQTETGGSGVANEAVIIGLTTQIDTIEGRTIAPPLRTTLTTRVNLRN